MRFVFPYVHFRHQRENLFLPCRACEMLWQNTILLEQNSITGRGRGEVIKVELWLGIHLVLSIGIHINKLKWQKCLLLSHRHFRCFRMKETQLSNRSTFVLENHLTNFPSRFSNTKTKTPQPRLKPSFPKIFFSSQCESSHVLAALQLEIIYEHPKDWIRCIRARTGTRTDFYETINPLLWAPLWYYANTQNSIHYEKFWLLRRVVPFRYQGLLVISHPWNSF